MTFTQLSYFIAIAETGSLNRAAERLFVSQPSLSKSMQELEREIGVPLLSRSTKGVTLTRDGEEFLLHAKEICMQRDALAQKYAPGGSYKKKFSVSTQHYSFAVKAFVDLAKQYDMSKYEFSIMETRTREVIQDVATLKSEIGVLFLSDFNRKSMEKLLHANALEFHPLVECRAYVYLWKGHPLAGEKEIRFAQLTPYPCLTFDQGDNSTFYLAEEILSTNEYPQLIRANDRATMLNLMVGLNGYTLCSGIICEALNGSDFLTIPFREEEVTTSGSMVVGYITRENLMLSPMGAQYVAAMQSYFLE